MAGILLAQVKRMKARKSDPRSIAFVDKSQGASIWYDKELFPIEYHEAFFEILSKFELVYWMDSVSKYLVPSGLVEEKLSNEHSQLWNIHQSKDHAIKIRRLQFTRFFPIGLFHRLIVQLLQFYYSKGKKFINYALWKTGIVLFWDDAILTIEQLNLAIQIQIQANNPFDITSVDTILSELLTFITTTIESNYPG